MNRLSIVTVLIPLFVSFLTPVRSQPGVVRQLEACPCQVNIDSSFRTHCAYLIVPENRKKKNGKTIKLPFIWVESKNPAKRKDPVLFTSGGPGGSSLGWAQGASKSLIINDRDCIAFEQRGTHFAVPNLWSNELSDAIAESYRRNLDKDSMVVVGVKRYKKALEAKGIDLTGYNTDETVSDMHDLLATLKVDSVNLIGISYSGGLMTAVLQRDPSRIRSLILDSPLPTFVPIDEDEPANFAESLNVLFRHVESDSTDKARYRNLKAKFEQYFTAIDGKKFTMPYVAKGKTDTLLINYTRRELLDILVNTSMKEVPYAITEMIKGNHNRYIRPFLEHKLERTNGPSGMRISVYCADQTAYHSEKVLQQLYEVYPYLKGYPINDVYKAMCDCWNVPPITPATKQPFYSAKPALLADGEMDNACRPLYIDRIHHYMPNSQRVLFKNHAHGVGGAEWGRLIQEFLTNPYQKLQSSKPEVVVY
ncbi:MULTISPECIES: alpha/beta hydrolase [unclassified Spirosoma]|uniref:alpha/beta hydrolase n=1 Tax=unclassified Spirosoma TaxID=2621999 RepID=UPI00095D278E|nr:MULTISPECIES: alpha/beta hydrolase [unclassified Spirosoma]MBN8820970.1 alpha/beta fold hydrolase [Spirosoma sp.]OJW76036.1 MAG: alpha/beta hydrolase [Spirosoma sp. 48-14]